MEQVIPGKEISFTELESMCEQPVRTFSAEEWPEHKAEIITDLIVLSEEIVKINNTEENEKETAMLLTVLRSNSLYNELLAAKSWPSHPKDLIKLIKSEWI